MRFFAVPFLFMLTMTLASPAGNWPAFRGPGGNGACQETAIPWKWSATENVRWKLKLPSPGSSSPIVWEDKIFLTQSIDKKGMQRAVLCIDRKHGKVLWEKVTPFQGNEPTHGTNPYCSATPVTDGKLVIASHGSAGVVCYDFEGNQLWKKDLGSFIHIWGNASSPVLYKNLVLLNCGPGTQTFLIAMEKETGKEVWRAEETGGKAALEKGQEWIGSWSTPIIHKVQGKDQLLMSWPNAVKGYDPLTGKCLWTAEGLTKLVYTSPIASGNTLVAMSGFHGSAMALNLETLAQGEKPTRLWHHKTQNPQRIGSGIISGNHCYMANAGPGTVQCLDLKTGEDLWKSQRLGGSHWASTLLVDGKLLATDQAGDTYIVAVGPEFKILGKNSLREHTDATPAISNGEIFIRTFQHLYCISSRPKE